MQPPTKDRALDARSESRTPVLSISGLSKRFPIGGGFRRQQLHALRDVSFHLYPGEIVSLVGESGSGKSTVARVIARLTPPSEGKIVFEGQNILEQERRASLAYRGRVQMIFQDPFGSLNPVHTIAHHLERPLLLHRKTRRGPELKQRTARLLEQVGLEPPQEFIAKYPHELSGGQRQRIAIARALAVEPRIILADEPTSMLDVSIRMGVLNLMVRLRDDRGLSFLYITHDIASARYIADRIMVMYAGQLVESAASDDLVNDPQHPYTQLLLSAVPDPTRPPTKGEIRGGRPSLINPKPGCPFVDRCPKAMKICSETMPTAQPVRHEHWARCHLFVQQ